MSCSICLDIIKNEGQKLNCNHIFHKECIEKWFERGHQCPLCRKSKFDISLEEYEKHYCEKSNEMIHKMTHCDQSLFKIISPYQKFYWFNIDPECD